MVILFMWVFIMIFGTIFMFRSKVIQDFAQRRSSQENWQAIYKLLLLAFVSLIGVIIMLDANYSSYIVESESAESILFESQINSEEQSEWESQADTNRQSRQNTSAKSSIRSESAIIESEVQNDSDDDEITALPAAGSSIVEEVYESSYDNEVSIEESYSDSTYEDNYYENNYYGYSSEKPVDYYDGNYDNDYYYKDYSHAYEPDSDPGYYDGNYENDHLFRDDDYYDGNYENDYLHRW